MVKNVVDFCPGTAQLPPHSVLLPLAILLPPLPLTQPPDLLYLSFCRCTGFEPKEGGATWLATPKQGSKMVFLVGTAAYIGPAPHLDIVPW